MEYKEFIISDYRAIKGPLSVSINRSNVVPIIGVNECGRTTILQAILCFDQYNDDSLNGRHLSDIENLYDPKPRPPRVTAVVKLGWNDFLRALDDVIGVSPWISSSAPRITRRSSTFTTSPLPKILL
jgi:hypothetical protein